MHWGRVSSVVNDPLGEPGHTPLYVGLASAWGCVRSDLMFFPIYRWAHLWGIRHRYMMDWMNKYNRGSGDGVSLSMGTPLGNMEGAPLLGTLREIWTFRWIGCRRFCEWVSLVVPLGNLGWGSVYRELWEIVGGGLRKWNVCLYGSYVKGTWWCKRRLWRWAPFSTGTLLGNLGEGWYETMKHRGLIFIVFNNMIVDRVHKVNDFKSAMSNMMPWHSDLLP